MAVSHEKENSDLLLSFFFFFFGHVNIRPQRTCINSDEQIPPNSGTPNLKLENIAIRDEDHK